MRNILLTAILILTNIVIGWAQPTIAATHHTVGADTEVSVDVSVEDFTDILEMRYSVNWDTNVLEFIDIENTFALSFLDQSSFDFSGTMQGYFTMDWRDQQNFGQTLPDYKVIYKIRFRTLASAAGLSSAIAFTDDPVRIDVRRSPNGNININLLRQDGSITIPPPPCRQADSLALVSLYNTTGGLNWTNKWDLSTPLSTWYGVHLNADGCIETLDLDGNDDNQGVSSGGNNLTGFLPNLNIPTLKYLYLSDNQLNGSIPSFNIATNLEVLKVDNNEFSYCPPFNTLASLQVLQVENNQLSFDDILPNVNINLNQFTYSPQANIIQSETVNLNPGQNYTIQLEIDEDVSNNKYEWAQNGTPYQNLMGVNELVFTNVMAPDEGDYVCQVTNPSAPNLALFSNPVKLKIECPAVTRDLNEQICAGQSYEVGTESFNTTGFYEVNLTNSQGCDSLVRLNLIVESALTTNLDETICNGDAYTLGGQTYTNSGDYQHTFTTQSGCDSTVFLKLNIAQDIIENLDISICSGESYQLGDVIYEESGTYQQTFTTSAGCDSIINLELDIASDLTTNLDEEICAGQSYQVGNNTYTETGSYEATLISAAGCDSVIYLQLEVVATLMEDEEAQICTGESYTIGNESFDATGMYQILLTTQNGCDSIVNLDLTVTEEITPTFLNKAICEGETYTIGSSTYSTTGVYQEELQSVSGCDSIVHLDLTVLTIPQSNIAVSLCSGESYAIGNESFSTTGIYERTLSAANGCDSLVRLDLEVAEEIRTNLTENICSGNSITIGVETFSTTGFYEIPISRPNSCDSIVMLDLTVLEAYEENIEMIICEGEQFSMGGNDYNETGQYQTLFTTQNGCDSIVNLNLTIVNEESYGKANGGGMIGTCDNWTAIKGNQPPNTFGEWESLGSTILTLTDPDNDLYLVENLQPGNNLFRYTLSTEDCPDFGVDTLIVNYTSPKFSLNPDVFSFIQDNAPFILDVVANDSIPVLDDVSVRYLREPANGNFTEISNGVWEFSPRSGYTGNIYLEYEVCNIPCPEICRKENIQIKVTEKGEEQPAIIITPNNDGLNEQLVFDNLDNFPKNDLIISNRWGSPVFSAAPYNNNWSGNNASGKPLPEGTYYYLLRLDIGNGDYQIGSVTIKR